MDPEEPGALTFLLLHDCVCRTLAHWNALTHGIGSSVSYGEKSQLFKLPGIIFVIISGESHNSISEGGVAAFFIIT